MDRTNDIYIYIDVFPFSTADLCFPFGKKAAVRSALMSFLSTKRAVDVIFVHRHGGGKCSVGGKVTGGGDERKVARRQGMTSISPFFVSR